MRIGIIGATGNFGKGLACRWAKNHTIYIGSRSREKAKEKAKECRLELEKLKIAGDVVGTSNEEAMLNGEVLVFAIHFEHLQPVLDESRGSLKNKIVISPIVSLIKEQSFQYVPPPEGSVALWLQKLLPDSEIVSALHTVPSNRLSKLDRAIEGDVPVCGNSRGARETVIQLIREIAHLNPIDAGPLDVSKMIEPIVPLILNLKQYSLKKNTCIKFI